MNSAQAFHGDEFKGEYNNKDGSKALSRGTKEISEKTVNESFTEV
jgi:hypothetical protein